MKALSGVDGAFLHLETKETPMHVASLHLFDLPAGHEGDFHADVQRQMRRRAAHRPGAHAQAGADAAAVRQPGVGRGRPARPGLPRAARHAAEPGTQAQLEDCVGRLHSVLLDRSRPLWRMAVIDGLQSGQVAYYFQIHHAVLDGQAGVLLSQALFDLTPTPRAMPRGAGAACRAPRPGRARRGRAEARRRPVHQARAPPARRGEDARRPARRGVRQGPRAGSGRTSRSARRRR